MNWTPRYTWFAVGAAILLLLIAMIVSGIKSGAFVPAMYISSTAFSDGGSLPKKYTCDGEGISAPISIQYVPKNTKSIVLYMLDQDAPKGGFVHWVVYNIDPKLTDFPEGKIPTGSVEGLNSAKNTSYVAVCPPTGKHRYLFTAYAVSSVYHFVRTPDIDHLKKVMMWQVLAKATTTATYTHQ